MTDPTEFDIPTADPAADGGLSLSLRPLDKALLDTPELIVETTPGELHVVGPVGFLVEIIEFTMFLIGATEEDGSMEDEEDFPELAVVEPLGPDLD